MNQLQQALAKAIADKPESELGKMARVAISRGQKRKRKKRKLSTDPTKAYHQRLKRTAFVGLDKLRPCSFTDWKPGLAVQVGDKTGRVKWGLTDGNTRMVVVLFDFEQEVPGNEGIRSFYGYVQVEDLKLCGCAGYLHKGCKP